MLKGAITPNLMNWLTQLEWFPLRAPLQLYDPLFFRSFPHSMKKDLKVPSKIIQHPLISTKSIQVIFVAHYLL